MIIIFDLDGTLLQTEGGNYHGSQPIPERVERLKELEKEGHTIVIQTARNAIYEEYTIMQLDVFGIPYHALSVGAKIYGDLYVDDRGVKDTDFFKDEN